MSTDSFTSSALAVSSTVGVFTATAYLTASSQVTPVGFFLVKKTGLGVTVTKATTLAGSQSALTFPITRDQAIELGIALCNVAN